VNPRCVDGRKVEASSTTRQRSRNGTIAVASWDDLLAAVVSHRAAFATRRARHLTTAAKRQGKPREAW
jgi:hypothetical protein